MKNILAIILAAGLAGCATQPASNLNQSKPTMIPSGSPIPGKDRPSPGDGQFIWVAPPPMPGRPLSSGPEPATLEAYNARNAFGVAGWSMDHVRRGFIITPRFYRTTAEAGTLGISTNLVDWKTFDIDGITRRVIVLGSSTDAMAHTVHLAPLRETLERLGLDLTSVDAIGHPLEIHVLGNGPRSVFLSFESQTSIDD